jgi:hypothetical protein
MDRAQQMRDLTPGTRDHTSRTAYVRLMHDARATTRHGGDPIGHAQRVRYDRQRRRSKCI